MAVARSLAGLLQAGLALTAAGLQQTGALRRPLPGPSQAFVHLFEWSWNDVAVECETWLGPKGFAAVQISPPTEHIEGPEWWTRYQPVTYNLTSRSGGEREFAGMVRRCGAAGVDVYVDAVFNHCAGGSGRGVAGSRYGNRTFPLYGPSHFHHDENNSLSNCAVNNYTDKHNVQNCDLVGMPDLCTECEHVQATVATYLNRLASLGVAGVRIDAAKHQDPKELARLLGRVSPNLYKFSEVIDSEGEAVYPEEYAPFSQVTEFKYGKGLGAALSEPLASSSSSSSADASVPGGLPSAGGGALEALRTFGEAWGLIPGGSAVVFVDNHDTQRGKDPDQLTYKSGPIYTLAVVFMLAHPYGYPQLMSSYRFASFDEGPPQRAVHGPRGAVSCGEGSPWVCEHRRAAIANMVAWRRTAGEAPITLFTTGLGGDALLFCRGASACVALNRSPSEVWEVEASLPLPPGSYCDIIVSDEGSSCPTVAPLIP